MRRVNSKKYRGGGCKPFNFTTTGSSVGDLHKFRDANTGLLKMESFNGMKYTLVEIFYLKNCILYYRINLYFLFKKLML